MKDLELQTKLRKLENDSNTATDKLSSVFSRLDALQQQVSAMEKMNEDLKEKLASLTKQHSSLELKFEKLKMKHQHD